MKGSLVEQGLEPRPGHHQHEALLADFVRCPVVALVEAVARPEDLLGVHRFVPRVVVHHAAVDEVPVLVLPALGGDVGLPGLVDEGVVGGIVVNRAGMVIGVEPLDLCPDAVDVGLPHRVLKPALRGKRLGACDVEENVPVPANACQAVPQVVFLVVEVGGKVRGLPEPAGERVDQDPAAGQVVQDDLHLPPLGGIQRPKVRRVPTPPRGPSRCG